MCIICATKRPLVTAPVEETAAVVIRPRTPNREPTAVDRARQVLEDEINAHKSQVIAKTRELNKLVAISCLPPELLTEIFLHFAAHVRHGPVQPYPYVAPRSPYGRDNCKSWIKIAHVSHYWREVALGSPRLWSEFTVDRPEWTKEMLARSKRAPLHLTIVARNDSAKSFELAMKELPRIESLVFKIGSMENLVNKSKLGTDAPLLKSLTITHPRPSFMHTTASSQILFDKVNLPSLTHLELVDTRISWQNPVFKSTLTHLTFRSGDTSFEYVSAGITTVLQALEGMPALQKLELKGVLPTLSDDTPPLIDDLMVNLPHLRTLLLGSSAKTCGFVLQHMTFPAAVTLQLDCTDLRATEATQLCPILSSKLRSDPEHGIAVPPLLSLSINETSFKAWTQDYPMSILHPAPSSAIPPKAQPKLCITLCRPTYASTAAFNVVLDTLPIASVRNMYLGSHEYTMEKKEWLRLCGGMTGLRELGVGRFGEAGLAEALATRVPVPGATPPPPAQGSSKKPRRKLQPFLPGLRTLQLAGLRLRRTSPDADDDDPGLLPQYTKMLAARRKSKCPLALRLRECLNVCEEDITELKKVAASVEWDGLEDWDDEDDYDDDEELYGDPYYDPYDEDFSDDEPPFFFFPW